MSWAPGVKYGSVDALIHDLLRGLPVYYRGRWYHSAFMFNWSLLMLQGGVERGLYRVAVRQP